MQKIEQTCVCSCHTLMDNFKWPKKGIKPHICCPKEYIVIIKEFKNESTN